MNQADYAVPAPIGKLLSLLPVYPGSLLFVAALNLGLARHFPADVQSLLTDKKMRISVTDMQLTFLFQWTNNGFSACRDEDQVDLTITASAHDFLLLAQRKEDPDTLFFSRRLVMEGDTELGLLIKNTLDAIEAPMLDLRCLAPGRVFSLLKKSF